MVEEESVEHLKKGLSYLLERNINFGTKNLEQLRSYWTNLIVISTAISGVVIPVIISNGNIFKIKILTISGVIFLISILILGPYYFNSLLTKENNKLTKERKELLEIYRDFNGVEDLERYKKKQKEKISWIDKHVSDILTYLFILGIISILGSLFPF